MLAWVFHGEREGEVSGFNPLQVEIGTKFWLRSIMEKIEEGVNFDLTNPACHIKNRKKISWRKLNVDT